MFKYRYCKSRMVAFLNDELPPAARRRIARYIDECPDCYAEYIRQRDLQHRLSADMPRLAQPDARQLDSLWSRIQAEIQPSPPQARPVSFRMRYGLVAVALVFMLLLPMVFDDSQVTQAAITQPAPPRADVVETTTPLGVVAIATRQPRSDVTLTTRTNTVMMPVRTPEANE